ncbi:MAG: phosphonate transport system permease protein [Myxococcota bacterium]|jgi:phosphonate transport system permease protein
MVVLLVAMAAAVWGLVTLSEPLRIGPGGRALISEFIAGALRPALWDGEGQGIFLPRLALIAAGQTVALAVAALSLAVVGGALLAPLLSATLTRRLPSWLGQPLWLAARTLAASLRSVHELLWAILLLAALGRSSTAAILAIGIPFAGMLARVYAALIDEADPGPSQALERIGAGPMTALLLARLPQILPDAAAYTLYRFECALRASAVLGFFGLPTLGYHIAAAADSVAMAELWTFLYALIALILLAEGWSGAVRRRLVRT